ncbi:hypothetical protein [Mycolicibacterium mengxianglii]|uniref:hypothetical protein n=1 Tax=Mycolicibacterium mengxianglii TaxID=2736649 RepID=UPI0018EF24E0|nr:hypothetical protein [Mycolicibacterium mengxianglii]
MSRSRRVATEVSYAALVDGLYSELADWIRGCAKDLTDGVARRIAVVGVNARLGKRATRFVFHVPQADTPDEEYVADWTAMIADESSPSADLHSAWPLGCLHSRARPPGPGRPASKTAAGIGV